MSLALEKVPEIPGPAGRLLALRETGRGSEASPQTLGLCDIGRGSSASAPALQRDILDFTQPSWLSALRSCDMEEFNAPSPFFPHTVSTTLKKEGSHKVPRLLLLVASCRMSFAGDVYVQLKDPTGSLNGALQRAVLEGEPDLRPGATVLLHNVTVFAPAPGLACLCITLNNIVQVFPPVRREDSAEPGSLGKLGSLKRAFTPHLLNDALSQPPSQQLTMKATQPSDMLQRHGFHGRQSPATEVDSVSSQQPAQRHRPNPAQQSALPHLNRSVERERDSAFREAENFIREPPVHQATTTAASPSIRPQFLNHGRETPFTQADSAFSRQQHSANVAQPAVLPQSHRLQDRNLAREPSTSNQYAPQAAGLHSHDHSHSLSHNAGDSVPQGARDPLKPILNTSDGFKGGTFGVQPSKILGRTAQPNQHFVAEIASNGNDARMQGQNAGNNRLERIEMSSTGADAARTAIKRTPWPSIASETSGTISASAPRHEIQGRQPGALPPRPSAHIPKPNFNTTQQTASLSSTPRQPVTQDPSNQQRMLTTGKLPSFTLKRPYDVSGTHISEVQSNRMPTTLVSRNPNAGPMGQSQGTTSALQAVTGTQESGGDPNADLGCVLDIFSTQAYQVPAQASAKPGTAPGAASLFNTSTFSAKIGLSPNQQLPINEASVNGERVIAGFQGVQDRQMPKQLHTEALDSSRGLRRFLTGSQEPVSQGPTAGVMKDVPSAGVVGTVRADSSLVTEKQGIEGAFQAHLPWRRQLVGHAKDALNASDRGTHEKMERSCEVVSGGQAQGLPGSNPLRQNTVFGRGLIEPRQVPQQRIDNPIISHNAPTANVSSVSRSGIGNQNNMSGHATSSKKTGSILDELMEEEEVNLNDLFG